MADYIAPVSWGLGDLLVSLPVVQALIAEGSPTYLITRSSLQEGLSERIQGLAGSISESSFDASKLKTGDRYFNLRNHPLQRDYWWGSQEFEKKYPNWRINDVLTAIVQDFGLCVDFSRLKALRALSPMPESKRAVIFIAGTDGEYKCWGKDNWLELNRLLTKHGETVLVIGQPDNSSSVKELLDSGLNFMPTPTLEDALDVTSACTAVVGVDTGLMHMAVQQGKETFALYRHSPFYLREYSHCHPFFAQPCAPECLTRANSCTNNHLIELKNLAPKTWSCAVDPDRRCMSTIPAALVFERLANRLARLEVSSI